MELSENKQKKLCDDLILLSKEQSIDPLKNYLASANDKEAFVALNSLRGKDCEKLDLLLAEYLAFGKGCSKNETEAGNLCAKIVTYLEKRNEFPPEYARACYMAASLLYEKALSFELNLGFAIDYDRRGAQNGNSEECKKRYEKNIDFLKNLTPKKYANEEMLYKTAAFVLSDAEKRIVSDNYWKALKDEALRIQKAYHEKYFLLSSAGEDDSRLKEADAIIEKNASFPDGTELYQKEKSRSLRPTLTASGTSRTEIFTKVSLMYHEYEDALDALDKTRLACMRKVEYEKKLGARSFEFWQSEQKVEKALEVCARKEAYENVFGMQTPEFWENDDIFFKHLEALALKEKYETILGENNWDFWLDKEKVHKKLSEREIVQSSKANRKARNKRIKMLLLKISVYLLLSAFFCFVLFAIKSLLAFSKSVLLSLFLVIIAVILSYFSMSALFKKWKN